jgi:DNA modification methylase
MSEGRELHDGRIRLAHGDCLEVLRGMPAASVDSVVTDPPAGVGFMGREWDSDRGGRGPWIAWLAEVAGEVLRVMKPGAHALVWALPRTSHWTATALEEAGFEVRDRLTHLFGSGFPKSLDIAKQIDGKDGRLGWESPNAGKYGGAGNGSALPGTKRQPNVEVNLETPEAAAWDGWGTALKPGGEDWWLVRKPLSERNVAANVLAHGCGGINVGACRVEHNERCRPMDAQKNGLHNEKLRQGGRHKPVLELKPAGRWPANVILSPEAAEEVDQQSGVLSAGCAPERRHTPKTEHVYEGGWRMDCPPGQGRSVGGASRYFYTPKPDREERNRGCGTLPTRQKHRVNPGGLEHDPRWGPVPAKNTHPTVKAVTLMRWLCRLITPPDGLCLDPFMGSGSTGVACVEEGFRFIGIEREAEYLEIAAARIGHAAFQERQQPDLFSPRPDPPRQLALLEDVTP